MDMNNQNNTMIRQANPSIPAYNNQQPYTNVQPQPIPAAYVRTPKVEPPEVLDFREKMGSKLGSASVIYGAFATFCLYNNFAGITMPFFIIATLIYILYAFRQYDVKIKKASWFYGSVILALSVSNFLTGSPIILFFNNVGIIFLLFIFLLHNIYDDSRWTFAKTLLATFESFIYSVGELDDYCKDMKILKQRRPKNQEQGNKNRTVRYILLGLLISIPVVGIILALLTAADAVFKTMVNEYISFNIKPYDMFGWLFTFAFFYFASYCVLRFFSKKTIKEEVTTHRNFEPLVAITVLSIISVIYLVFSVIQIVYLFWGGMQLPAEYTYAEYAREGFFQLLAVSIINFIMVLFVNGHFRESRVLKILMTIISLCTYIMIASSCMRMLLYIDAYLLTTLRIYVLWGLALLSLLFIAVIISIYKNDFPLFRYSIIVVSLLYLGLSFAHTDYIIADYNLSHINDHATVETETTSQSRKHSVTDYEYLTGLSSDAAPVIAKHEGTWVKDYFTNCSPFYRKRSWRQFNLSAYTAKKLAKTK